MASGKLFNDPRALMAGLSVVGDKTRASAKAVALTFQTGVERARLRLEEEHRGRALWILRLLIIATFVAFGFWLFGQRTEAVFAGSAARSVRGHLYVVPLKTKNPFFEMASDSNSAPTNSKALLFEGRTELGPAHSLHADIATQGKGRYSHWQDKLYFSASDNSDPRSNGRSYRLSYRLYLHSWVPALLALVSAIGFLILKAWRVEEDPLLERSVRTIRYVARLWTKIITGQKARALWVLRLLIIATFVAIGFWFFGRRTETLVDGSAVRLVRGQLYVAPLKINHLFFEMPNDSNAHPAASKLRLYEGRTELGPLHSQHIDIANLGGGRYSHWGGAVYFSTSDYSDPRTNGRTYRLTYRLYLQSWIPALLALVSAIGFLVLKAWRVEVDPLLGRSVRAIKCSSEWLIKNSIPWFIGGVGIIAALLAVLMLGSTFAGLILGHADPVTETFRWSPEFRVVGYIGPYFPYLILTGALLGSVFTWIARLLGELGQTQLQLELKVAKALCYAGLPLFIGALFLILASAKSGSIPQFNPNGLSIGGYIPFNDGNGHWICPIQQAITGHWMSWCDRRPLATAVRTVVEFLGRYDHELAQLVQATFVAFGLYVAAAAIAIWAGAWSAMAFSALALIGIYDFAPTTWTAPLGFFLGALALAAFALSLFRKSIVLNTIGVFLLTFALLVRMGSMFSIPAVVVWSLWRFRESGRRMAVAGGAAVLAVLIVAAASQMVAKLYGAGTDELGSNFSYSLAGLSLGGDWELAQRTYGDEISRSSQRESSRILYQKAIHNIINNPAIFLGRLVQGEAYFWQNIFERMLYGYKTKLSAGDVVVQLLVPTTRIILLVGVVLLLWYRLPRIDDIAFIAVFVTSLAGSVPFIIFDDGWRALMATTPFCAALLAFALKSPQANMVQKVLSSLFHRFRLALICCVPILLAAVTAGPWYFHSLQDRYREVLKRLPASETGSLNINTDFGRTGFVIVDDGVPMPRNVAAMSESSFEDVLRWSGIDGGYHKVIGQHVLPRPPYSVFVTSNIDTSNYGEKVIIFFGPARLLEDRGFYRVSYAPVPNALKHGSTVFYQIKQAIPLTPESEGDSNRR